MSNKLKVMKIRSQPTIKKQDWLVNYKISRGQEPVDLVTALKVTYDYMQNNPVFFKVQPAMHNSVVLFSVVGFLEDHKQLIKTLKLAMKDCGCVLENSKGVKFKK